MVSTVGVVVKGGGVWPAKMLSSNIGFRLERWYVITNFQTYSLSLSEEIFICNFEAIQTFLICQPVQLQSNWSFSQELKTLLYICNIFGKMCWNFSKIEFQLLTLACKAMRQTCTLGSVGPTNNNNLITILFWSWCKKGEWEQCLLTKKFLTRGTRYQNNLSKHVKYKRFG